MPDNIIIRAASLDDAQQLSMLHQASFGPHAWTEAQITDSLTLPTTKALAAYAGKDMAGFILLQQADHETEILTFCVHPDDQRQKIGERLLQETINKLPEKNITLFLEVAADNVAACNLYRKLGFQVFGRRPGYYTRGNGAVDAILYKRTGFASAS